MPKNNRSLPEAHITRHVSATGLQAEIDKGGVKLRVVDFVTMDDDVADVLVVMCRFPKFQRTLEGQLTYLYNLKKSRRRPKRNSRSK